LVDVILKETKVPGAELGVLPEVSTSSANLPGVDEARAARILVDLSTAEAEATLEFRIVSMRSGRVLHMVLALAVPGYAPFPGLDGVLRSAAARTVAAARGIEGV